MKIVIIDDDEALLTVFGTALKKDGFEVITAIDGVTGVEKVKTEKPDMVLVDQILPDMRGNDIVKLLQEQDSTKTIPLAVLSNFGQNELIKEALSYGAKDYILKYQIEPLDLISKVHSLLKMESPGTSQTDKTEDTPV